MRVQVYKYNTDLDGKTEWVYFGDEIEQFEDEDGTGEVVVLLVSLCVWVW